MSTLNQLVNDTTVIKDDIIIVHSNLKSMLESKKVSVSAGLKINDMVDLANTNLKNKYNDLFLYKLGDECVDYTGGWGKATKCPPGQLQGTANNIVLTKTSDNLYFTGGGGYWLAYTHEKPVDLTDYNMLVLDISSNQADGWGFNIYFCDDNMQSVTANTISAVGNFNRKKIAFDISNIKGEKFLHLHHSNLNWNRIYSIELKG